MAAFSNIVTHVRMVSIIVGFVFHILCTAIGHQNLILTVRCAVGHALLCMAKIGSGVIVTHSIAERITVIILKRISIRPYIHIYIQLMCLMFKISLNCSQKIHLPNLRDLLVARYVLRRPPCALNPYHPFFGHSILLLYSSRRDSCR